LAYIFVAASMGQVYLHSNLCSGHMYVDIRGGSSWLGPRMRGGLSMTAIFDDLSGYFFANFRDKASNIIWRYAIYPLLACDWLQNEWPRM